MEIRVATEADVATIAGLRRAWVEENAGASIDDDSYESAFADWFARESGQRLTWLAEVDGVSVGMLNVLVFSRMPRPGLLDSRWGYLANFYVAPDQRGTGIGTALLEACTTYADEQGFVRIVLSPSERSVPLYERAGFRVAEDLRLRPGPA